MTTLHIQPKNPTFCIALLALGLLTAIKSNSIPPEAGIWTLRLPKNYRQILPYCTPELQNIIECFDELDALSQLDTAAYTQTINRLIGDSQHILAEHTEQYELHLTISASDK